MTITANECPRCGYHPVTEVKEGDSALEAEVRRLEDLIPRLQEEKASLLRRINNAQAKTRHLPFEVLSNIFLFARPPIDFAAYEPINYWIEDSEYPPLTGYFDPAEYFHHTLAAVSHRWRQVALSTPQLWTSISLRVLNTFIEFDTSLLDLYFKNAHNIPISIRLDLSNPALAWTAVSCLRRADFLTRLEPLEEIIFDRNADKIHSLVFIEAPVEWFSDCGKLSRCTSVTMYWPSLGNFNSFHFDFEVLPCLQHVKVVDDVGIQFTLPTTLSALQLSDTRSTQCRRPLEDLPYFVELEITDGSVPLRWDDNLNSTKLIVLHCLKKFTWNGISLNGDHDFLRYVRFVNLTTYEWRERKNTRGTLSEEGRGLRLAFFSSLPSTLSSLTFGNLKTDSPGLVDLLCCVPQLAELHFSESPREVVVGAVEMIGRRSANRGASSSRSNILPNLCALSVSGTEFKIDAFIFIEMLEALHAAGPRPKQFLLTTDSDDKWRRSALRELRALLSSGMDVKVIYDRGEFTYSVPSD
ncbi:hypothetical protein AGABI1DRAFT_131350 [Agaricus bisporus var. burnettii JB137-S8]|uniref:Uncharacterized protein n=1 Tax=Agaricus bisporus var. burnettii (strain JB137-S8 / ATCC MYA-4627 / FGSC 10392) TaxID=597362 RepID=K5VPX6_AGABU|nr:uncharacterized protein AGABI1DRAFT_131350 [Agaricus bisporus var. burnettii JB137-S8]EKM76529.1 hypothetical protein AGABI1DRAFT_131350 [Agaricus bisporus var. burnettii JB137-S8]